MMDKNRPAKRRHPILEGRAAKLLDPFRLKMTDLPEEVPYLSNNALRLPAKLAGKQIRQIGVAARILDRNGFSLGDLLVWLKQHPEAPIAHEEFVRILLHTGLSRRSIYNYQSLSNSFPPNERLPGLSRPHHNAVRLRGLPKREQQRLLREALKQGWTDVELGMQARIRQHELAMPASVDGDAANRSLVLSQMRLTFEKIHSRNARTIRLLSKPHLTVKELATLNREIAALQKEIADAKELLVHGSTS